ncbi:MAG: GvpL/GvpF family gas vesicle protein [Thermoplasmata archaeon]
MKKTEHEGVYLYCIVEGDITEDFGRIGIEKNRVYTLPFKDVSAVVHSSKAEPYNSKDERIVKEWILSHQNVVDKTMEKYGTVIPFSFDTIIRGKEKNLKDWLETDYKNIKNKLRSVKGKKEYGIQISIDEKIITKEVEKKEEIRKLKEKIEKLPKGTAYMFTQQMKNRIKNEIENKSKELFDEFYTKIKKGSIDTRIEKNKDTQNEKRMILNVSVLLKNENIKAFGDDLEKINKKEGVSIRFVGPFAPYSFVSN